MPVRNTAITRQQDIGYCAEYLYFKTYISAVRSEAYRYASMHLSSARDMERLLANAAWSVKHR